jgi:two-component system nitrogen regulation sensor histidine kinase NtrY
MRLRTTLALAIAALSLLQAFIVAPFALRNLDQTLTTQLERRIDGAMVAAETALEQRRTEVRRAVEELAERVRADELRSWERDTASELMAQRGLTVLSVFDAQGTTLSSGHLPSRLGDPDPVLFQVTRGGAATVPVLVELRDDARGVRTMPALVAARPVELEGTHLWMVGGMLIDPALAEHFSRLTSAKVEVFTQPGAPDGPAFAAGAAEEPVVTRALSLDEVGRIELHFSRSDLLASERQLIQAFSLFFGLGLVLAVGVGVLVTRRITRPVEALTTAVTRVAHGALDTQVEERAVGEVGALVRAFNRMISDLRRTTEQLVASERVAAWQEVARRLAHEIKNPLTPIKMSLETLLAAHEAGSPRFGALFKESAGAVLEEVDRLARIVDEFSRFARLPKPVLAPVDLGELVGQVLSLYASPPPGVELKPELAPGVTALVDRDQLTQVLVNLIKNAEEALQSGSGRITVRVKPAGTDSQIEVEDTGPGIPPADRARIFEPYFTTKAGGTGLGLAIASRICQEHGGRLEVGGGAAAAGARFTLTLPKTPR